VQGVGADEDLPVREGRLPSRVPFSWTASGSPEKSGRHQTTPTSVFRRCPMRRWCCADGRFFGSGLVVGGPRRRKGPLKRSPGGARAGVRGRRCSWDRGSCRIRTWFVISRSGFAVPKLRLSEVGTGLGSALCWRR